jgi:hypothetical protein
MRPVTFRTLFRLWVRHVLAAGDLKAGTYALFLELEETGPIPALIFHFALRRRWPLLIVAKARQGMGVQQDWNVTILLLEFLFADNSCSFSNHNELICLHVGNAFRSAVGPSNRQIRRGVFAQSEMQAPVIR